MADIVSIQNQFGHHLFNFIKSQVNSIHDAEDIYQEVVYKLISKSEQLKKTQSLKSWLFTIARNQVIDFYRAKKQPQTDEEAIADLPLEQESNTYQDLTNCLQGFIDALPVGYREVIVQSELEGKSQKEVSEALGINYVTLRSKVQRARDKVRAMIYEACVIDVDKQGRFVSCTPKGQPSCDAPSGDCNS